MLYLWEEPFVVDHSRFAAAFGFEATPLDEAISHTVEWFRTHPQA
jgi:nucleoside-diphosphate-sugar epimerase